ncbi:NlpC/P60 family protein [Dermabacter sp. p3-SID358]|uniref:NlpC/P60 family protein n=1 Tax=Dermabacter sp. p3-SID358 TaxID=2916114 RepID=UPI0021A8BC0D|nr:NlpC/P60 family protein [Dermabacter sp. p3-SID358]MCT1866883.1 NlpC/P60 family protein [Dermabacter sp. p3-SID358]
MYPLSSLTGRKISAALIAAGVVFTPLAVQAAPAEPTDDPSHSATATPASEPTETADSETPAAEMPADETPSDDNTDAPLDTPSSDPSDSSPVPSSEPGSNSVEESTEAPTERPAPRIRTFSAKPQSAPTKFAVVGAMRGYWEKAGGTNSWIGNPTSNEKPLDNGGVVQHFESADLYWSPSSGGSHAIMRGGAFEATWKQNGHTKGWLGYPTSDEIRVPGGVAQIFNGGTLYFNTSTRNVYITKGSIRAHYNHLGGTRGWLGFPTSNEIPTSGGVYQYFTNGIVYYSSRTGAHAVANRGAIISLWGSRRYERGELGFPTSEEYSVRGGRAQDFQNGTIYWNSRTGATQITKGAIGGHYKSLGGSASWLGLPTSDEIPTSGGVYQYFTNGIVYYSSRTGAHAVANRGAIISLWGSRRYERGELGFPTSEEYSVRGGRAQDFQNGTIYWNSRTGVTEATKHAIRQSYNNIGGPNGALGLPRSSETKLNNGVTIQYFERGNMYWHPRTGAYAVHSGILDLYAKRGFERGFLGLPTSHEYTYKGQYRQNFENGVLYWTSSNGAGVVGWEPANPYYFGPTNHPTTSRGGHNLTKGWNGVRVAAVQKRLGIYSSGHKATMDTKTINAVKSWQRKRGLPVTGVVDKRTWDSLGTGVSWYADGYTVKPRVGITASRQQRIDTMVNYARSQVGSPYTWGGAGTYNLGFDCSGIAIQAMNAAGLETGVTPEQHAGANWLSTHYFYNSKKFRKVPISQLQRGDWIFYRDSGGTIRHMTMYLGNGQMLHSWGPGVHIRSYTRNLPGRTADAYVLRPF